MGCNQAILCNSLHVVVVADGSIVIEGLDSLLECLVCLIVGCIKCAQLGIIIIKHILFIFVKLRIADFDTLVGNSLDGIQHLLVVLLGETGSELLGDDTLGCGVSHIEELLLQFSEVSQIVIGSSGLVFRRNLVIESLY